MLTDNFDLVIIGGGLAGASLICALAPLKLRIALVEAKPLAENSSVPDARSLTLSDSSRRILDGMGLWRNISPFCTSINTIHVSERGRFASTQLRSNDLQLPALGYVVPFYRLLSELESTALKHAFLFQPAQVQDMIYEQQRWKVTVALPTEEKIINTPLVIAADGAQSQIRQRQNISAKIHDYLQSAIVTQIKVSQPQANTAFERFTDDGLLALLPRGGNCYGVTLIVPQAQTESLLTFDKQTFLAHLQKYFGYRLGRFTELGKRQSYPLQLIYAKEQARPGLLLLGNAAHTLHPVAGQGFNLVLRDIARLAQTLAEAKQEMLGAIDILQNYAKQRKAEQQRLIRFTDGLLNLFSSKRLPAKLARNLGMLLLNHSPSLQRKLTQHLLGRTGTLPDLACGLPLDPLHGLLPYII